MTDHATGGAIRIVVGVDGSPGSKPALAWAMNQARLTVEAVTTCLDAPARG